MVNVIESGAGGRNATERTSAETRIRAFEAEFFDLIERNAVVAEMFAAARDALLHASITVRAADSTARNGWSYQEAPDHAVRLAAFDKLATVLRLKPTAQSSVTVNANSQTLNVTTSDRLAELDAIGVPRAEIQKACADLLEASSVKVEPTKGESVS